MGSTKSKAIGTLADSVDPFLATTGGITATTFESFRIQPRQYISQINVLDVATNQVRFQLQTGSSIVTPVVSNGHAATGTTKPTFPEAARAYDGDQQGLDNIRIAYEVHLLWPSFVSADFKDRLSGDACRVVIEGYASDYKVYVYLERASKTLPPRSKKDDRTSSRFQTIGRIRNVAASVPGSKHYIVDAVPGVDLSLLLQLWLVRYEIEIRPPTSD